MTLHTYNVPIKYPLPTLYGLQDIAQKDFIGQGHNMTLHIYNPPTNVPTKYPLPTPYCFRDIIQKDFVGQGHYGEVKSRSHYDIAHLHPLTNVPTKYQLHSPYSF